MNNGDQSAAPFEYEAMAQGVSYKEQEFGLTKREDIAKHLMAGLMANNSSHIAFYKQDAVQLATFAVANTDALLAALEKS